MFVGPFQAPFSRLCIKVARYYHLAFKGVEEILNVFQFLLKCGKSFVWRKVTANYSKFSVRDPHKAIAITVFVHRELTVISDLNGCSETWVRKPVFSYWDFVLILFIDNKDIGFLFICKLDHQFLGQLAVVYISMQYFHHFGCVFHCRIFSIFWSYLCLYIQ